MGHMNGNGTNWMEWKNMSIVKREEMKARMVVGLAKNGMNRMMKYRSQSKWQTDRCGGRTGQSRQIDIECLESASYSTSSSSSQKRARTRERTKISQSANRDNGKLVGSRSRMWLNMHHDSFQTGEVNRWLGVVRTSDVAMLQAEYRFEKR